MRESERKPSAHEAQCLQQAHLKRLSAHQRRNQTPSPERLETRGCNRLSHRSKKRGLKSRVAPGRVDHWKGKAPSSQRLGSHLRFRERREHPNHKTGGKDFDEKVERDSRSESFFMLSLAKSLLKLGNAAASASGPAQASPRSPSRRRAAARAARLLSCPGTAPALRSWASLGKGHHEESGL